jgi:hypothetical protein
MVLLLALPNGSAINLSAIADASNPTGGFVINGEATNDYSGVSGTRSLIWLCTIYVLL